MENQVANSFDSKTVSKIVKGAIIAMAGAAALGLLDYLGTVKIDNPMLASFVVWVVPVAANAVKEWRAGA